MGVSSTTFYCNYAKYVACLKSSKQIRTYSVNDTISMPPSSKPNACSQVELKDFGLDLDYCMLMISMRRLGTRLIL